MRVALAVLVLALALLLGAVWIVPGLLDWNQYRGSIAALASSALGRPVRIEGDVTLTLLPQPVLTASRIQVADAGDAVTLTARELRLRVALGPLLAGQVDARELAVSGAELSLPWPPAPGALAQRPPAWLTGLQARLEGGRVAVGGLVLSGIDSTLVVDADTGTLSAAGTATVGGRSWRFTARLARPGRDGSAGLEWSLDGQGALRDTGGTFTGQVGAEGSLAGRVAGRGPDLSQLLPAPAVAWRAEGRLSAAGGLAVADELALEVGGSPAQGTVALRVAPEARLDLSLAAGRLDLDAWLPVLMRGTTLPIPTGLDLSAEAATLAGGTLRTLRGAFDLTRDGVGVRDVAVVLPGGAQLGLTGAIQPGGRGARFEGAGSLVAPDLRATLRWLEPLVPGLLAAPPAGVLQRAELSGRILLDPEQFSLSDVSGALDGAPLTGGLGVRLGARPALAAGLSFERLLLDPWLPLPTALAEPGAAAGLARRFAGFDADLNLQVRQARWLGHELDRLVLDAKVEAARLTLRRLDAAVLGVQVGASGTVGEGGRVQEGMLELTAPDLGPLRGALPAGWERALPLLQGAGSARLQLAGPPDALAARLNLDLGDARVEAKPVLNVPARRWLGPVTLRHPGAPRLLESLGLRGADTWLGEGSLSLVAQVAASADRVALDSFDLVAGAARLGGQVAIDEWAGEPSVTGRVVAEALPLPTAQARSPDPLPAWALRGWRASLRVEAAQVLAGLTTLVRGGGANAALEGGTLRVTGITGTLEGGGTVGGAVMVDAAAEAPRVEVQAEVAGATLSASGAGMPFDLLSGTLDGRAEVRASGHSPAALLATLSGTTEASIQGGELAGLDLRRAGAALLAAGPAPPDAELRAALAGGTTPFERLRVAVTLDGGVATLGEAQLTGTDGQAALSGTVDLPSLSLDLRATVRPTLEQPAGDASAPGPSTQGSPAEGSHLDAPELAVRLTGLARSPRRVPELAALVQWLADRPPQEGASIQ